MPILDGLMHCNMFGYGMNIPYSLNKTILDGLMHYNVFGYGKNIPYSLNKISFDNNTTSTVGKLWEYFNIGENKVFHNVTILR